MKAIVQTGYGSPDVLELQDIDKPAIDDDQVLVKVRGASVNAYDWHLMQRMPHLVGRLLRAPASRVRGGDLAGVVEAVGKNVTRLWPGDEVFGVGRGTFAEYAMAPEDRVVLKPPNLTFEQAAAIPGAGCTALQGLRDWGQVKAGQRVLIYGAGGGVGTFAVQIGKALGAHVTAVTRTENLDLVRSIGADEVIDYTREDFTQRGQNNDVLLDIGADRSYADCRRVMAPNGKIVLCGAPRGSWSQLARIIMMTRRSGGRRTAFLARAKHEDLLVLKELVEGGKLSPAIDRQYFLSEVPDALRYLGSGRARGKVVIHV